MWYCGIDVSCKKSYMVVSDEKGKVVLSKEVDTTHIGFHTALRPYAESLKIVIGW